MERSICGEFMLGNVMRAGFRNRNTCHDRQLFVASFLCLFRLKMLLSTTSAVFIQMVRKPAAVCVCCLYDKGCFRTVLRTYTTNTIRIGLVDRRQCAYRLQCAVAIFLCCKFDLYAWRVSVSENYTSD